MKLPFYESVFACTIIVKFDHHKIFGFIKNEIISNNSIQKIGLEGRG